MLSEHAGRRFDPCWPPWLLIRSVLVVILFAEIAHGAFANGSDLTMDVLNRDSENRENYTNLHPSCPLKRPGRRGGCRGHPSSQGGHGRISCLDPVVPDPPGCPGAV